MIDNKYAVIKLYDDEKQKSFTLWHNTYEEAKEEAERLCKKEQCHFGIIKLLSKCYLEYSPIKWEE